MTLAVTDEKMKSLISQCKTAQVIGIMISMTPAVLSAPLHYWALQELKNTALDHHHSYFAQITDTGSKTGFNVVEDYLRQWKSRSILPKEFFWCWNQMLPSWAGVGYVSIRRRCMEYTRDDPPHQLHGASWSWAGAPMLCFNPTECVFPIGWVQWIREKITSYRLQ